MKKSFSTEGIVLARRNYSEADRIINIITKGHGRASFMAKGIRKPTSRKRASLEVFTHISLLAYKTRGINIITEAETIESFKKIRKSLNKVSLAYFYCEVVGRITHEEEKNDEVFDLLLKNLTLLTDNNNLKKLRAQFTYDILTLLGFWPKGRSLLNPDAILESVLERKLSSIRVGKKLLIS